MPTPQTHPGLIIRAARVVPAPPDAAYRAFTEPSVCRTWWGRTEKGELAECEIDARVGGSFRFAMRRPSGAIDSVSGRFVEVFPAQKLSFSWLIEDAGKTTETFVTMDFLDLKDGSTRILVTHQGLPTPQATSVHSAGWHDFMQDMSLHFIAKGTAAG